MQNANRKLKTLGGKMQKIGKGMTLGITTPLLGIGALAVKTFADFEQAMAKVNAISGATDIQFKKLEESALALGRSTRFTSAEVANLQLNYSKLGFSPEEIIKVTAATLDLALATGSDLANSATVAASTLRGFGLEATEMQHVVDVMALSFSSSALDLEKFQTAMGTLAPVAKNAGVSLDQATGYLSILVDRGVDATTAGTGLRNIFLDLAGSGQTLDGALGEIRNSTNKNKVAFDLFGKRGATVAAIMADNADEANNLAVSYSNSEGAAKRMAAIMDNTLQGSFLKLKSAVEGAMISIGQELAPVILKVADYVSGLVTKFTELSPSVKKFILVVGGVAAAIGPLLALAGTILPAIGAGFALLTGPIGLIALALTGIGVIIYKNWVPIKKTLNDIANYFIELYNESTVFRIAVEAVSLAFKNMFNVGRFVFETLKNIVGGFIEQFTNGFKTVGKIIKAVLTGDIGAIPGILKDAVDGGKSVFTGFTDELKNDWKDLTDSIKKNGKDAFDNVVKRKLKILEENVDATAITDAVSGAVTNGLGGTKTPTGGTGGSGGAAVTEDYVPDELKGLDELLAIPDVIGDAMSDAAGKSFLGTMAEATENDIEKIDGDITALVDSMAEKTVQLSEIGQVFSDAIGSSFGALGSVLAETFETGNVIFDSFIQTIVQGLTQLAAAFVQNLIFEKAIATAKKSVDYGKASANAIVIATNAAAALGPFGIAALPGLIASQVGIVSGAFAGIAAFADGGIVGGSSFYGDKLLARVNSGELILNEDQQKKLYNMTNSNSTNVNVGLDGSFRLDGQDLILAVERATKRNNRTS